MPVTVVEKYEVVVTLEPNELNTYIMEEGVLNLDATSTELAFTMEGDKSLFILFSENAITKTEYTFTAGRGGDEKYSITRVEDSASVETNKILFNSNKKIQISGYFLGNTKYKIELKAIPLVTEGLTYTFSSWTGGSTETTYEIITSSPKSITANFTYIAPTYQTGTQPTATTSDGVNTWTMISEPAHLLWLANAVNNNNPTTAKSGKYKLAKDIDYNNTYHEPIGHTLSSAYEFRGVIDGAGFAIKNAKFGMSVVGSTFTGFIGQASSAIISNLTIDQSCVINSSAYYVGSVVAYDNGSSYITR